MTERTNKALEDQKQRSEARMQKDMEWRNKMKKDHPV